MSSTVIIYGTQTLYQPQSQDSKSGNEDNSRLNSMYSTPNEGSII